VLRDRCAKDNDFLRDFVWFVTGSSYVQRLTNEITVEFNYKESSFQDSLPVAHTCAKLIKLPGHAYDGSREVLEMKLDKSIQYTKVGIFDMS
jgi:HECT-domain (ubiquitin-transferase)